MAVTLWIIWCRPLVLDAKMSKGSINMFVDEWCVIVHDNFEWYAKAYMMCSRKKIEITTLVAFFMGIVSTSLIKNYVVVMIQILALAG